MDCIDHGVAESWTRLSDFRTSLHLRTQRLNLHHRPLGFLQFQATEKPAHSLKVFSLQIFGHVQTGSCFPGKFRAATQWGIKARSVHEAGLISEGRVEAMVSWKLASPISSTSPPLATAVLLSVFMCSTFFLDSTCSRDHEGFFFLCLDYFILYYILQAHPCCCKWQDLPL